MLFRSGRPSFLVLTPDIIVHFPRFDKGTDIRNCLDFFYKGLLTGAERNGTGAEDSKKRTGVLSAFPAKAAGGPLGFPVKRAPYAGPDEDDNGINRPIDPGG